MHPVTSHQWRISNPSPIFFPTQVSKLHPLTAHACLLVNMIGRYSGGVDFIKGCGIAASLCAGVNNLPSPNIPIVVGYNNGTCPGRGGLPCPKNPDRMHLCSKCLGSSCIGSRCEKTPQAPRVGRGSKGGGKGAGRWGGRGGKGGRSQY